MDRRIVFTNGCFDIFHYGHLHVLREASYLGDFLIVGINSDYSIKQLKGDKRPIFPLEYRMQIISSLSFVGSVIPFEDETPLSLIISIKPDVLVKGGDYSANKIVGSNYVKSYGGKVRTIPLIDENKFSSTEIIKILEKL